jgi:type I restriction enzyme S subunit
LEELFDERNEIGRNKMPLLSITADRGVIPRNEVVGKDTSSEDKSHYKRVVLGDIAYNTMRMWQGVSAVSSLEGIVSPAYTICIPRPEITSAYAGYLFKVPFVVYQFFRHSQGLVDDTLNLKFHNFSQVRVRIPELGEQKQIARVLQSLDSEIGLLTKGLVALKQQKRGLMQQLLTGTRRISPKLLRNFCHD